MFFLAAFYFHAFEGAPIATVVIKMISTQALPFLPVRQAHSLGCGVACVASRCGLSYEKALKLFAEPENAWIRGFYCDEMVAALKEAGHVYSYHEFNRVIHEPKLNKKGTIIFIGPNQYAPAGHYLLRTAQGWMNPWANFPQMIPIESAIESSFQGLITHIIFEVIHE